MHISADDLFIDKALFFAGENIAVSIQHFAKRRRHVPRLTAMILKTDDVESLPVNRRFYRDIADTAMGAIGRLCPIWEKREALNFLLIL